MRLSPGVDTKAILRELIREAKPKEILKSCNWNSRNTGPQIAFVLNELVDLSASEESASVIIKVLSLAIEFGILY